MKLQTTCESCEQKIKIDYDETMTSVSYCPFCGEELDGGDEDFEITHDTQDSDWD
jgi:transcription initiation factor IIE alpha subunit